MNEIITDGYSIVDWSADERALHVTVMTPLHLVGVFSKLARTGDPEDDYLGNWEYKCADPPHGPGGGAHLGEHRDLIAMTILDKLVTDHPVIPHAVNLRYFGHGA